MRRALVLFFALCPTLWLGGCTGVPDGIEPVKNFEPERYLGKWYEIARLNHSFEQGLTQITAEYSLNSDGSIRVLNRGYSSEKRKWKEAEGRAVFVGEKSTGHLKVSFFRPFYASYVIIALDDQYQYAMVTGYDKSYLWILSRKPQMPEAQIASMIEQAKSLGYATDQLIFVEQETPADTQ